MGLRFDPVGGGRFQEVVKTIIEKEREPIKNLEQRKAREEAKIKLFQEFKGKLSGLQKQLEDIGSISRFRELKVDLGDGSNLVNVTVDKEKAQPGQYQLQVDQLAGRASMISKGFSNPDDNLLGVGFVVMELANGENYEVYIDPKYSSLKGVASQINNAQGSPVRASVVRDAYTPDSPWRLIVTAKDDGAEKDIHFPEFYFLDGTEDFWIDDQKNAQNAYIKLDGFDIDLASNDVSEFLSGVNLHLRQSRPESPFTLTISQDTQKISGKMKGVVDQVNGVLEFINKQNQIDKSTDTRTTFAGDSGLQSIEYRLRNLMHEGFPYWKDPNSEEPEFVWLNQVGVEIGKNGMLTFSEEKFNKALEGDFDRVAEAVTGEYGFANQLKAVVQGFMAPGQGMVGVREQALRQRITQIDDTISRKERVLEQRSEALVAKFSRLQGALSDLQRQQSYLGAIGGGGGGSNIVSQLLG